MGSEGLGKLGGFLRRNDMRVECFINLAVACKTIKC